MTRDMTSAEAAAPAHWIEGFGPHLDLMIARQTTPGVVCGVDVDGEAAYLARGVQSPGRAMSMASRIPVGCLAKLLIAIVVLQLAEEGLVALDAPIGEYLSEIKGCAYTLEQLLSHSAGYREPTAAVRWTWTWDDLAAMLREPDQAFPAGFGWSYTQSGHVALAKVIEHVTGKTLTEVLVERLIAPLGLSLAAQQLISGAADIDDAALHMHIYKPQRRLLPVAMPNDTGALRQSIAPWRFSLPEILRLGRAIGGWDARDEGIISDGVRARLAKAVSAAAPAFDGPIAEARPRHWSLGLGQFGAVMGHTGSYVGCTTALYLDFSRRTVVAVSMNSWDTFYRQGLANDLLSKAGAAIVESHQAPTISLERWSLSELAGVYRPLMLGGAAMTFDESGRIAGGTGGRLSYDEAGELQLCDAGATASLRIFAHPVTGQPALASGYSLYTRES
jgi:CubicO group peptidase (beta-lactamase class C family)